MIQAPFPAGSVINSAALTFTPNQDAKDGVGHESLADVSQQAIFDTISPGQLEQRYFATAILIITEGHETAFNSF
jgi:hypothetical protein